MTAPVVEKRKLSVSQVNSYERCAYAYKLERVDKVWQQPAAWLGQGSAVHEAAEAYEKSGRTMSLEGMQEVFIDSYARHIGEALETTPNMDWWFASGPYRGDVDIERRFGIGLDQCRVYQDYYKLHPGEVLWVTPDGVPGAEVGFDLDMDGVLVRGYIDAIVETEDGLVVRDLKTGNNPSDAFQLGVYAIAIEQKYPGVEIAGGDYHMVKSNTMVSRDIREWSREEVIAKFKEIEKKINAGEFPPNPSDSNCRFCSVANSCEWRY